MIKIIAVLALLVSFNAQAELIYSNLLQLVTGTTSGTLAATQIADQTGTDDDTAKYLALIPNASNVSTTRYEFTVPAGSIEKLVLKANYKGKPKTAQTWRIQLWNNITAAWVNISDNTGVTDGVWSPITAQVLAADFTKYVNASSIIKMRVITTTPFLPDTAKLDQLAFDVIRPAPSVTWWQPTPGGRMHIQYAGTLNTNLAVSSYNIDLVDTTQAQINAIKANGKKVICYFSAGSWENWRPDQASFPASVKGNTMDGWPDEKWLDVRALSTLMPIMEARMDLAVSKGCDAVDPDNMDGYTNSTGFTLTRADQLAYFQALADAAHARGLALSLKNAMGLLPEALADADFSVNEQCYEYNECDTLLPFIAANKPVYGIEYNRATTVFCPSANSWNFDSQKKTLDLNATGTQCR